MTRSNETEIMDSLDLPEDVVQRTHRDLDQVHRLLGDTRVLLTAMRYDTLPVKRVLDVGCGHGGLLLQIQRRLGVDVVGVDLRPPLESSVTVLRADAVRDPLPAADVAISAWVAHHLSAEDLVSMIQNVGRSCRRFILLDLVRSRIPLALFRAFVAPWLSKVNASDGCTSIRRSFTPEELASLTSRALEGTKGTFQHSVSPLRARQVVDIRF